MLEQPKLVLLPLHRLIFVSYTSFWCTTKKLPKSKYFLMEMNLSKCTGIVNVNTLFMLNGAISGENIFSIG